MTKTENDEISILNASRDEYVWLVSRYIILGRCVALLYIHMGAEGEGGKGNLRLIHTFLADTELF